MSIKTLLNLIFFVLFSNVLIARNDNLPVGARSAAMGNSTVVLGDLWSVNNNQAGLTQIKTFEAGLYANRNNLLSEASVISFAAAMPSKFGTLGLTFHQYGFKLYNESKVGLAFAKTFGPNFRAGLMADYLQTAIGENYGKNSSFCLEAGIQAQLVKNLWIGTHFYNLNRAKASNYFNEKIPSIMRIGLMYTVSDKVFASAEIEKDLVNKPIFKGGAEYKISSNFMFRAGFSIVGKPIYAFGIGFYTKGIRIDIAGSFHPNLGFTPHLGLGYYSPMVVEPTPVK